MDQKKYQFGLVGFPLGHSLSPRLHKAALEELGLCGDYNLFPIPDSSGKLVKLNEVLNQIRSKTLNGINVTIPYKEIVFSLVDTLTPVALATGAVNTVYLHDDQLAGDNTDVAGFSLDLLDFGVDYQNRPDKALVLGAGGAARAVVYVLAKANWNITIAARRLTQAEMLSRDTQVQLHTITPSPIILSKTALEELTDEFALIVNTTPVGMAPNSDNSPWPRNQHFPSSGLVYDLVYNPRETSFLQQARLSGLATRNGLGMLVRQAAAAFERWTGRVAPFEAMWKTVDDFRINS